MDSAGNSQGDEGSYQDPTYYDGLDSSMNEEGEYTGEQKSPLREQDRFLPIANVAKIMKRSVPSSGKIAKEAKECVQECVSEFISFITSEAVERCIEEKRKTVNGEDILFAVHSLGFDNYIEPLKKFLLKYREASKLDTSMFDDSALTATNTLIPGTMNTVFLSLPQTPIGLQSAATQPGSTPIAARPITISSDGHILTTSDGTITIGGQQFAQQLIIAPQTTTAELNAQMIKQEEGDVKFTTTNAGTFILPLQAGQVLINGTPAIATSVTSSTPVTATPSTS